MLRDCACRCRCYRPRLEHGDGLCEPCWRKWAQASTKHQPIADPSYLGTYGLNGIWTPWLLNTASYLLEQPALSFQRQPEGPTPKCPDGECGVTMRWRPGAWKCFHHDPPIVQVIPEPLPEVPMVKAITVKR